MLKKVSLIILFIGICLLLPNCTTSKSSISSQNENNSGSQSITSSKKEDNSNLLDENLRVLIDELNPQIIIINDRKGWWGGYFDFDVFIDNSRVGIIERNRDGLYNIYNGIHTVYIQHSITLRRGDEVQSFRTQSDKIDIFVNNDRHIFRVGSGESIRTNMWGYVPQPYLIYEGKINIPKTPISIVDNAINNSFSTIIANIPNNANIALLNILSNDNEESGYILDELMILFINSKKVSVVDRNNLDIIRKEQNFQISGDVDDETAVSIGKLLGAKIVLTGNITGTRERRRLRIKAIDVETGRILAMSSENI